MLIIGVSTNDTVNTALDLIDEDLEQAALRAIDSLNVLAGQHPRSEPIHEYLKDLHDMVSQIAQNRRHREDPARWGK